MADSESSVRQRKLQEKEEKKPDAAPDAPKPKSARAKVEEEDDAYSPYVDILRVLSFLFVASCGLSYLISGGETWFWGMKNPPNYLQVKWWKSQFVRVGAHGPRNSATIPLQCPLRLVACVSQSPSFVLQSLTPKQASPIYLTLEELSLHDGSDPTKTLYLAINGTIYDVSANPRIYGPGGGYNVFAGTDASRGFVTGCFADDRTADMRGVEEMFLPLDDPEIDRHWTAAEMRALKEKEMEEAKQKAHDALKHWVDFFGKSKKYHKVGYVKRPAGWPGTEPIRQLCEQARNGRTKRTVEGKEES
jgi:predicted heme/steroid binding protein